RRSAFKRDAASRERSHAPHAGDAETKTSAPVLSRMRLARRGPSFLSPSGSCISNLRAPLPVISATSLSSSRSYMDNTNLPLGKNREASVRYKRPRSESQVPSGLGYTSVKLGALDGRRL